MKVLQTNFELEAAKARQKEQEAFNAQYQIVGVQEELAQTRTQVKVVEEERDALKTSLKEEEVARIAAQGRIALPPASTEDDEFASPVKQKPMLRSQSPEKESSRTRQELEYLREQLEAYKARQEEAELQVDFMRMECQFGCCSCRLAERQGAMFVHDDTLDAEIKRFKPELGDIPTPPESMAIDERGDSQEKACSEGHSAQPKAPHQDDTGVYVRPATPPVEVKHDPADEIVFSPDSGTFRTAEAVSQPSEGATAVDYLMGDNGVPAEVPALEQSSDQSHHVHVKNTPEVIGSSHRRKSSALASRIKRAASHMPWSVPQPVQDDEHEAQQDTPIPDHDDQMDEEAQAQDHQTPPPAETEPAAPGEEEPTTPFNSNWQRTSTTTTKVPLKDDATETPDYSAFCSPLNITREQAIEQLRARRGRARSVAGTPKKTDGTITPRRDISAPEVRVKGTPRSASRGRLLLR